MEQRQAEVGQRVIKGNGDTLRDNEIEEFVNRKIFERKQKEEDNE